VPFSFLLVLLFMLCAVISSLVAAGVVWARCTPRWRYLERLASTMGIILATLYVATFFTLHALLVEDIPLKPLTVAIAGGTGFTAGASGICAWIWARRREDLATADCAVRAD
jgi:hypothetical protein